MSSNSNSDTHQKRVEAGKKGAAARWGKEYNDDDQNDQNDENDNSSNNNSNNSQRRSSGGRNSTPQSGKGRNQGQSGPRATQNPEDDVREEDTREDEGAGMKDFGPGKNPTRQQVGRRVAAETGHEELAARGRKGGQSNRGNGAKFDYDDIDSYLEHPELGVPDKEPNRVRGGKKAAETLGHDFFSHIGHMGGQSRAGQPRLTNSDMGESPDEPLRESDMKDPNRQQGGYKAAAKLGREHYQEIGRMGQQARQQQGNNGRAGNSRNSNGSGSRRGEDNDDDYDDQEEDEDMGGKNPNRVRGGQKAAETRARNGTQTGGFGGGRSSNGGGRRNQQHDDNEDEDDQGEDEDMHGKNPNRVRGGQKAAETRARNGTQTGGNGGGRLSNGSGRRNQQQHDDNDYDEDEGDDNEDMHGKNPNRVRGGQKAAETRARHGTQTGGFGGGRLNSNNNSNRGSRGGNDDNDEDEEDMGGEDMEGKDPVRVRAGQKAAETRRRNGTQFRGGSRSQGQDDDEEDEDESSSHNRGSRGRQSGGNQGNSNQQDHEFFSRIGKMGADARWHNRSSVSGKRRGHDEDEDNDEDQQQHKRRAAQVA